MAYSCSVCPQMVTYKATAWKRAVDPYALVRSWGVLRQAGFGVGSGPLTVPGCTHNGRAHTQHLECKVLCDLLFKMLLDASAGKGFAVSLQRTLMKTDRKHLLVKSASDTKPGEIVSECNTLELCLHKQLCWLLGNLLLYAENCMFPR